MVTDSKLVIVFVVCIDFANGVEFQHDVPGVYSSPSIDEYCNLWVFVALGQHSDACEYLVLNTIGVPLHHESLHFFSWFIFVLLGIIDCEHHQGREHHASLQFVCIKMHCNSFHFLGGQICFNDDLPSPSFLCKHRGVFLQCGIALSFAKYFVPFLVQHFRLYSELKICLSVFRVKAFLNLFYATCFNIGLIFGIPWKWFIYVIVCVSITSDHCKSLRIVILPSICESHWEKPSCVHKLVSLHSERTLWLLWLTFLGFACFRLFVVCCDTFRNFENKGSVSFVLHSQNSFVASSPVWWCLNSFSYVILTFACCSIPKSNRNCFHFACRDFDATLGFPGEGPNNHSFEGQWSCVSANIDSIVTHPHVFNWEDNLILLQETRVAESNLAQVIHKTKPASNTFVTSKLLTHIRQKNGIHRIPHGGTGIIASSCATIPFQDSDDITGLWTDVKNTTRVSAAWIQVTRKVKILSFSFYAFPCITADFDSIHATNDEILKKILEISVQFGDIPVIIGGDFQDEPLTYESFRNASSEGWTDPLYSLSADHSQGRPITFSRSGNFSEATEQISSIDGILLNRISTAALSKIEILTGEARQHAPIRAVFTWQKIFQKGFELIRPAAFDFTNLKMVDGKPDHNHLSEIGNDLWGKFQHDFASQNDEVAWKAINHFGISILEQAGATFKHGPRTRSTKPMFKEKVICPGQSPEGNANTPDSAWYGKTHALIAELRVRLQRPAHKTSDMLITYKLQQKVSVRIRQIPWCSQWDSTTQLNDCFLANIQKTLQMHIRSLREKEKYHRISSWRNKMKEETKNKSIHKNVFKWVKQKQLCQSNNLIKDSEGNLITNPIDAIDEINNQWDEVYSSNLLHEDPYKILSCVWPYIQDCRVPATIPDLDGPSLKNQILRRRIDASPGLDGWRTLEAQLLPDIFYTAIAEYFVQVEKGLRKLPVSLTSARQVILDKADAQDSPLQKRLITVLPVFLLAYSGLRFRQLQDWQSKYLPIQLFGGIKSRYMTSVATKLRLEIDEAKSCHSHILGIKLDKSKCFDRLVASTTVALFSAFGIPQAISNFFLQMYSGLRRYLTYKNWASRYPTTAANGLAQGDSFSLLAINLHMAVWAIFVRRFPIDCAVFIDDAYIWARVDRIYWLQQAIDVTTAWDTLTGQCLNHRKSQMWSTSAEGRKKLKTTFVEMELVHVIDVLGTKVQTSDARSFKWNPKKTYKIKQDIKHIGAIPCKKEIRAHLIGMKVIPQIGFTPHINEIPKAVLCSLQDNIASVLWRGRPLWRSKMLVIGLFSSPHRCDPFIARAYATVVEVFSFLKTAPATMRQKWLALEHRGTIPPNSLYAHFLQACKCLDITYHGNFLFSIWDCQPASLLDFSKKDLKAALQTLCRHQCYAWASRAARKDIVQCTGVLDITTTNAGRQKIDKIQVNGLSLGCHFENVLVGCTFTRDRMCAIGQIETNLCRFCEKEKETMKHLTEECQEIPIDIPRPQLPIGLGSNFANLGIVEFPFTHIQNRLVISEVSCIPCPTWDDSVNRLPETHLWTDGSVQDGHSFLHARASFAIVTKTGQVKAKGKVSHWTISSYTAELWALIYAFVSSHNPVVIHTDCKSVADQVDLLCENCFVPLCWTHLTWWNFLLQILLIRKTCSPTPVTVKWCKAHQGDNIPLEFITPAYAIAHGFDFCDLYCNRIADEAAKQVLKNESRFSSECDFQTDKIFLWQKWLSLLHAKIGADYKIDRPRVLGENQNRDCDLKRLPLPHEISTVHDIECFINLLPKWSWLRKEEEFPWIPDTQDIPFPNSHASISETNWNAIVDWSFQQKWKISDNLQTSWIELACCAYFQGLDLVDVPKSPCSYATLIQKVFNQCKKLPNPPIVFPGEASKNCKANGKTHPIGVLKGCELLMPISSMKFLATKMLQGCSHVKKDWMFEFPVG